MDEQLNHQDIETNQDSITIEDALRPIDVLQNLLSTKKRP